MGKRDIGLERVEVRDAHIDAAREEDGAISSVTICCRRKRQQKHPMTRDLSRHRRRRRSLPSPRIERRAFCRQVHLNIHVDTIRVENAAVNAEDCTVTPATRFELAPIGDDQWLAH